MKIPITTGGVARLLNSTEPQLGELVRRGKINPPPAVAAGRRLWSLDHLRQAAIALGRDPDQAVASVTGSGDDTEGGQS